MEKWTDHVLGPGTVSGGPDESPPAAASSSGQLAGGRAAIEELHRRYASVLFSVCMRFLQDRQEAEDAVQDTFLSAFRALPRLADDVPRLPWLVAIATNASLKILRTRRRRPYVLTRNLVQPRSEPRQRAVLVHRQTLRRLLSGLDERSQQILLCHHYLGMTQGEVAQALGLSRRAVVKRLTSVRAQVAATTLASELHD